MKIFQIYGSQTHCELTHKYSNADEARKHYASNVQIEDAPDYVFLGWKFDATKEGDARFIKPTPPEGWVYDEKTGTFWNVEQTRQTERTSKHAETTNDTMEALRKIRAGDTTIDWEAWLNTLDAYNVAIEETVNQEDYPLKVIYPEYPVKPQP